MDRPERRRRRGAVTACRLAAVTAVAVAWGAVDIACTTRNTSGGASAPAETSPVATGNASLLRPPPDMGLQPVTVADSSTMEASVREQLRARYSSLAATIQQRPTNVSELGTAYGELGELLMAATYFDAAEACYL